MFAFFFNAFVDHTPSAYVYVYLNGDVVEHISNYANYGDSGNNRQLIGFWTMNLHANDQVYLSNGVSRSIYIDEDRGMYWMSIRLN